MQWLVKEMYNILHGTTKGDVIGVQKFAGFGCTLRAHIHTHTHTHALL